MYKFFTGKLLQLLAIYGNIITEEMALNYGDEIIEIEDGKIKNHIISTIDQRKHNKEEILPTNWFILLPSFNPI